MEKERQMDWKFKLSEARIEEGMLTLGVTAEGPYDVKVRSPKVTAVIDSSRDNRRFPILVNAYFPLEDMDTCMIYAEYAVNIEEIFLEESEDGTGDTQEETEPEESREEEGTGEPERLPET